MATFEHIEEHTEEQVPRQHNGWYRSRVSAQSLTRELPRAVFPFCIRCNKADGRTRAGALHCHDCMELLTTDLHD